MQKHLFLDLEDTVITPVVNGWFNTHLINVPKIEKVIQDFKPDQVHLFSFAIWNQEELLRFNMGTRSMIEDRLNIKLNLCPTVDDNILPDCCRVMGIAPSTMDFSDMSALWGKHEAFRLFCRSVFSKSWSARQEEVDVLLLDDAVFNETFEWPDLHLKGKIVNIDTLE